MEEGYDGWYSARHYADTFSCGVETFNRWASKGRLQYRRLGHHRFYRDIDVRRLFAQNDPASKKQGVTYNLTEKLVTEIPRPEKESKTYFDKSVRGFGVRITPNDVRSYVIVYRIFLKQRLFTIGRAKIGDSGDWTLGQARARARHLRRQIAMGRDPMKDRRK